MNYEIPENDLRQASEWGDNNKISLEYEKIEIQNLALAPKLKDHIELSFKDRSIIAK